jgi:S-methylmethionine-dependent homocysteine/selenocysteine methylase
MPTASATRAEEFREQLLRRAMVADGAMGTMLYPRRVFINRCFDELNISTPDMVRQIRQEYVKAGAEILETNTSDSPRSCAPSTRRACGWPAMQRARMLHNGCCHSARDWGASDRAAVRTVAACGLRSSGKMIEPEICNERTHSVAFR